MRLPRLTWGGLDLGDHLVVGGRRLANELARILRVQDYCVDVVAGEGADRVDRRRSRAPGHSLRFLTGPRAGGRINSPWRSVQERKE